MYYGVSCPLKSADLEGGKKMTFCIDHECITHGIISAYLQGKQVFTAGKEI